MGANRDPAPRGAKEFLRRVQTHAAQLDVAPQRILHLLRVGAICAMLNDVHHEDGGALFIVKGGTATQTTTRDSCPGNNEEREFANRLAYGNGPPFSVHVRQ